MKQCAVNNKLSVPFVGKVINPPNLKKVNPSHKGTRSHVENINKVATWLSLQGWNVIFEKGGDTGVVPALRNITINTKLQKQTMLYALLHEAGHVKIFSKSDYSEKYKDGYARLTTGKNINSFLHRMDVLTEELAAWEEGETIAANLLISIDRKGYKAERNRSMKTYISWVLSKK